MKKYITILAVFFVVFIIYAFQLKKRSNDIVYISDSAPRRILLEKERDVLEGEIVSSRFTVINQLNESVELKCKGGCSCTEIKLSKVKLLPKEKCRLDIAFNSKSQDESGEGKNISVLLFYKKESSEAFENIEISGTYKIHKSVRLPEHVKFGRQEKFAQSSKKIVIDNFLDYEVKAFVINKDDLEYFDIEPNEFVIAPRSNREITIGLGGWSGTKICHELAEFQIKANDTIMRKSIILSVSPLSNLSVAPNVITWSRGNVKEQYEIAVIPKDGGKYEYDVDYESSLIAVEKGQKYVIKIIPDNWQKNQRSDVAIKMLNEGGELVETQYVHVICVN